MAENDAEKTEMPTPRRLEEARQEGNIAKSQDLIAAVGLLAAVLLLNFFGMRLITGMKVSVRTMLAADLAENPTRANDIGASMAYAARIGVATVGPFVLAVTASVLAVSLMQTGFLITGKPLELNLAKLSPLKGFSNLFSMRSLVKTLMNLGKLMAIAAVVLWAVMDDLPKVFHLVELQIVSAFGGAAELIYGLALKLAILLIILAIIDYWYQQQQRLRDLKMSKQEIKEEMKRMEGDPLMKQRRSRIARQIALQRVNAAVPRADVIVTNPTHFAIALKYDPATMTAPKVIAKGADFLAMRIRQLAAVHGVPILERKELARALYKNVEVGKEIPPQFFNAVAEIMAYVYRLSGRKSA